MARPYNRKNKADPVSRSDRPKRRSFAEQRNSLTFEGQDENYVYRIFNDVDDRLQKAEIAGYEVVRSETPLGDPTVDGAKPLGSVVTKPVGSGRTGVLMRIKREYYDEDQQAKLRKVQDTENALANKASEEGHYGGISIKR